MIFSLWGLHVIILNNRMMKETQISNKLKQISCFFSRHVTWLGSVVERLISFTCSASGFGWLTYVHSDWLVRYYDEVAFAHRSLRQIKYRISSNKRPRCNKRPPPKPKHQTSVPSPPPSLSWIHIVGVHGKPVSTATLLITLCVFL